MSKNKLSFRVDASKSIGLGHISRCIELARLLKNNFDIFFYSKEMPENLISTINEAGLNFNLIKNEDIFFNKIKNQNVVLDGYQFNSDYQKNLSYFEKKLICIDERTNIFYHSDVLINNNPDFPESSFKIKDGGKVYSGIEFSILKEAFRKENKKKYKPLTKLSLFSKIFICFGGSDSKNLSKKTAEIIARHTDASAYIVLGSLHDQVNNKDIKLDNVKVYSSLTSEAIIKLVKKSDLAIVPCSTIMLEVFCIGKPLISGWFEENQKNSLEYFNKNNFLTNCGNFNDKRFEDNLVYALENFDLKKANKQIANQKAIQFSDSKITELFNKLYEN